MITARLLPCASRSAATDPKLRIALLDDGIIFGARQAVNRELNWSLVIYAADCRDLQRGARK